MLGKKEQDNILHICVKRQVSESIFKKIMDKVTLASKKELILRRDINGNSPLHLAVSMETSKAYIYEGLLSLNSWNKSENSALPESDKQILDVLSLKNNRGKTVAHEASKRGHLDVLKYMWLMISSEGRLNRTKGLFELDDDQFTCLHLACTNENKPGIGTFAFLSKSYANRCISSLFQCRPMLRSSNFSSTTSVSV
jgi:ankyrin repeat protein